MTRRREAGFAILLEMMVVLGVLVILLAIAAPSAVQLQNSQNAQAAKTQVYRVRDVEAALAVCVAQGQTCTTLSSLVPEVGTIQTSQFSFLFAQSGSAWSYSAAPIANIHAPQSFFTSSADGYVHCSFLSGFPATAASTVCP
jgi:type II secretory pathway pseudopilin PulG